MKKRTLPLLLLVVCGANHQVAAFAFLNDKAEARAVQRFHTPEKLCKSCPARLEPKVSILEEMIVGLTDTEREELLANVAKRIENGNVVPVPTTPRRLSSQAPETIPKSTAKILDSKPKVQEATTTTATTTTTKMTTTDPDPVVLAAPRDKLVGKMTKTKTKYAENKIKLERVQQLLTATNLLLARNLPAFDDQRAANPTLKQLQGLTRSDLQRQRLQYQSEKSRIEAKLAKYRKKAYEAGKALNTV